MVDFRDIGNVILDSANQKRRGFQGFVDTVQGLIKSQAEKKAAEDLAAEKAKAAKEVVKVNINKASAEELMKLKKVGKKLAAQIVEYREKNGPFTKAEYIMKLKGFKSGLFKLNKDAIILE